MPIRLALLSDVHGNLPALEAVLDDIRAQGADACVVLGDVAVMGPFPEECVARVQDLGAPVVRGNTDEDLAAAPPAERADQARHWHRRALLWGRDRLTPVAVDWLRQLPVAREIEFGGLALRIFHATPGSTRPRIPPDAADDDLLHQCFAGSEARLAAYGHIHVPYVRTAKGRRIVNPGPVSLSRAGDARASYCVVDIDGNSLSVTLRAVPFDSRRLLQAAR
ncbi:MAG: metallophosphoesterase family protein, partial [Thermaerobacterales bacterium]